ncbi:MAG: hypothetical protein HYZ43_04395 [Flavobacteriia bacterium]|nr:hypothetical protein [Flavobacteriia bacterium]
MQGDFLDQDLGEEKLFDRPVFLTCLCILTWVGCWFILLYYAFRIYKINDVEGDVFVPLTLEMEYLLMKVSIVTAIISGFGTYLMWHQRRLGFFIYLFGQIATCAFGLYVYLLDKDINVPTTYYFTAFYVAQLGFVVLYSLNWKALNNTR